MIIVLDTNIVFSALISPESTISNIIFNSDGLLRLYSCDYLEYEIRKHWLRIIKISGLTEEDLTEAKTLLFEKINFIHRELIPQKALKDADFIAHDIDPDDSDFIALTIHLKGKLWTGDKKLYYGLKTKGFDSVVNTLELMRILISPDDLISF